MKQISLLALAAVLSTAAFSQTNWGIQATGNLSNVKLSMDGAELFKNSSNVGFGVGVVSDISLGKTLSLRPSLNLLQKGGKLESAFEGIDDDSMFPSVKIDNKF